MRYLTYRVRERARGEGIAPQWLKTTLAGLLWFLLMPIYTLFVSSFTTFVHAVAFGLGILGFSLLAVFLWPPRTPAWRTLFWAFTLSAFTGYFLQSVNLPGWALAGSSFVGFATVLLRVNGNGRRVWRRWQDWRDPLAGIGGKA